MYREEKQENKPSVVELGVLCVPWVLRSSGMTAVSWYPAAHRSHGTPINRCMPSFQKKTGFNPPNLFSILATLDPFPFWPIQCHPIQLFLLLLLLRSSSRPEGAVKVCGITVQHRPGEGAGMSSCVWSIVLHLWHLYLSPLYDVLDHTNIWSCQCVIVIMTHRKTNTQWFKDPTHAVFLIRGFKDI